MAVRGAASPPGGRRPGVAEEARGLSGHGPTRGFRFAAGPRATASGDEWLAAARRVESLGYDTLLVGDHLGGQFAPLLALAAAAAVTSRVLLGTHVLANDYRNPVMLAKEAATLDVLSGGRLVLGLGTGWLVPEYPMLGIAFDPPRDRLGRLAEAIGLMKRLWTGEPVDHHGRWYRVQGATVLPTPAQRPQPRLLLGGSGPAFMRLAGREADVVSITAKGTSLGGVERGTLAAEAALDRIGALREAAGDRFGSIELHATLLEMRITDDRPSALAAAARRFDSPVSEVADSPYVLVGSLEELREQLLDRRARFGFSSYNVPERLIEEFAPLARELRALREG